MPVYKPGDIIIESCVPFVKAVTLKFRRLCCSHCFRLSGETLSFPCEGCKLLFYCNEFCRNYDWELIHSQECGSWVFRKYCHTGDYVDTKVLLFRMCTRLKYQPHMATYPFLLHDGTTICFDDVFSAAQEVANSMGLEKEFESMADVVNQEWSTNELTGEYFQRLYSITLSHAIGVFNQHPKVWCGYGIYIEPTIFDYSCKPNAMYMYSNEGVTIQVRAIGPIPEGEYPCISYSEWIQDTAARTGPYQYKCGCRKCESDPNVQMIYDQINLMVEDLLAIYVMHGDSGAKWIGIQDMHFGILQALRKIYCEYDERITGQFVRVFGIAANLRVDMCHPAMKDLVMETREHLRITYGEEHPKYEAFQKKIHALDAAMSSV